MRERGLNDPGKIKQYNNLSREIQTRSKHDKNSYYNNICTQIQLHADKIETRDIFLKINQITGKFTPQTWAVTDTDGKLITEIERVVNGHNTGNSFMMTLRTLSWILRWMN